MLGLPKSTELKTRIPKQKFYENLDIKPKVKRLFIDQIKNIYWRNKIAASTMNLAEGSYVKELEVFEIQLHQQFLDEAILHQIDKALPYHIIYILSYEDVWQVYIGYKEQLPHSDLLRIVKYYHTQWQKPEDVQLTLTGLNIDTVYENYVRQVAGDTLKAFRPDETIKQTIERNGKIKELQKKIDALQARIRKEKQFNRQIEMNNELKKLKSNMKDLEISKI